MFRNIVIPSPMRTDLEGLRKFDFDGAAHGVGKGHEGLEGGVARARFYFGDGSTGNFGHF